MNPIEREPKSSYQLQREWFERRRRRHEAPIRAAERSAEMLRRHNAGESLSAIGRAFGVSHECVRMQIRRAASS